MARRLTRLVLAVSTLSCLASAPSGATPLSTLQDHCNAFIAFRYPGGMTASASEVETISGTSDIDALALAIVDNWYVLDPVSGSFVQLVGPQKQQYIDLELKPRMVTGALVASVTWTKGLQVVNSYALVHPSASGPGDMANILDGVVGFYVVQTPTVLAANPFHQEFENGFGSHVADYDASLTCVGGNTCSGDATCNEVGLGCGCKAQREVHCLDNGNCQMEVAFVGYCGSPDVKFSAKGYKFEVSGWGWEYYNASLTLDAACACTKNQKVGMRENSFAPAYLSVPAGWTVTWENQDPGPHSTKNGTSPGDPLAGQLWDSDFMHPAGKFSKTFELPGLYPYFDLQYFPLGMQGTIEVTALGVPDEAAPGARAPVHVSPNPSRGVLTLSFWMPSEGHVTVDILDVAGRRVARAYSGRLAFGPHNLPWRGSSADGAVLPSGIYSVRVSTGTEQYRGRFVIVQ